MNKIYILEKVNEIKKIQFDNIQQNESSKMNIETSLNNFLIEDKRSYKVTFSTLSTTNNYENITEM